MNPSWHAFHNLSAIPGLVHGVFTRHGGVSEKPYATLNVAWNNGDAPGAVEENLLIVKNAMRVKRMVASRQVHGDSVHVVDEKALVQAAVRHPIILTPPGDALITDQLGIGLLIKIADCQAIFIVDPVRRIIANVHCGWRGSAGEIPVKVIALMRERFGCRPQDLLAGISPSLGPCCAEFRNHAEELPAAFRRFQTRPNYFDFWAITRWQLVSAGLRPEHIEAANRCTVCEANVFFSYRGEKTTGRNAAVLAWH